MKLLTAILETGPRRSLDFFLAAVPVDICNVAAWLKTTYPTGTQLSDHRFILDPPFDAFWMEYDDSGRRTGFVFEASEFSRNHTMLAYGFKDSPPSKLGAMLIEAPEDGSTPVCRYVLNDDSEAPFSFAYEKENCTDWYQASKKTLRKTKREMKTDKRRKRRFPVDVIIKNKDIETSDKQGKTVPLKLQTHITEAGDGLLVHHYFKIKGKKGLALKIQSRG